MLKWRLPFFICIIVITLIVLPYLFAAQLNSADSVFGGFLINPVDGHSYLAKMQQGFHGEWRFVLPYTAEAGNGAFLFLFYIGLGHLSRILSLPLIITFHGARILGALFLLAVLYKFNKKIFNNEYQQNSGFAISAMGSGLGWIAILAGMFTSDFWVAEAYPFLSMYTNPHFPIGLALMILALMPDRSQSAIKDFLLGLFLGIIQPFAVVIVIFVKTGRLIVDLLGKEDPWKRLVGATGVIPVTAFAIGSGVILVYQYWSILNDPILYLWNSQNVTKSPGFLDLIISLLPCLILAGFGFKRAWESESGRTLVIWTAVSLVLVLVPWNLQRRFLTGIFVPLAGLAVYGLSQLERLRLFSFRLGVMVLFVLAVPTNIIVLVSGIQAASNQDPQIFYSRGIQNALTWINENTHQDVLVLADEEIGLLIPSITGRRVVYGHPFETVDAESEKTFLGTFFGNERNDSFFEQSITERDVDILLITGDTQTGLEGWLLDNGYYPEYQYEQVLIYDVGEE